VRSSATEDANAKRFMTTSQGIAKNGTERL
jgi:hypothetical protein